MKPHKYFITKSGIVLTHWLSACKLKRNNNRRFTIPLLNMRNKKEREFYEVIVLNNKRKHVKK